MLSNMNQQAMDTSILYYNSHTTKNTTTSSNSSNNNNSKDNAKEFSIYGPDVDFSINYEPIGQASTNHTRLVGDAKDSVKIDTSKVIIGDSAKGGSSKKTTIIIQNGDVNGRRAVMMSYGNEYPTNLHNYSKVPDMMMMNDSDRNNNKNNNDNTTNHNSNDSTSRDDTIISSDVEDENVESRSRDDNNNASNKIDDIKPEHHVRRPMNAFLIFCKRHRALVREKYPNLENRSITKILGDWWAFLANEDKLPYKDLAKNYKDVFFSKNPNFKWYKLPAPPLRTLSTRPGNDRDQNIVAPSSPTENGDESLDMSPKDRAARNIKPPQANSGIGQFKLASIDQMGGLSSLMIESSTSPRTNGTNYGDTQNKDDDSVNKKRKSDDLLDIYDDELAGKSRACKGKRYEQFMTPTKKATKQKSANALTSKNASVHFLHNGYCKPQEVSINTKHQQSNELIDSSDEMAHSPESDETSEARNGDANDFKLNDKIMTLPSLDLDDYLNRKKAMKKKKKFTHKSKHRQQQNAQAVPKDKTIPKPITAVGSQKRKAPKQTIRRTADVNEQEISRVGLIGLDTLATLALVQANASSPQ